MRLKDELLKGDGPLQKHRVPSRKIAKLLDASGLQEAAESVDKV